LKAHWKNRAHEKCGRHFNGEVTSGNKIPTLLENQLQKNIIVEEGKVSQVQRLVNTVHLMAKHNISNAIYEPLIRLQTANGADMGTQYFSPESFKQLVTGLDTEVLKQIIEELVGNDFFSFSGDDGATDVAKLSQETGSLRLLDTKTMLPKDVFLSSEQLDSAGPLKCGRTLGITDRFRAPSFYTECFCRETFKKWSSSVRPLQQLLKFEYRLILSHIKLYQALLL